ncbi:L,D-transpeptidase family protein [Parerythrobacter aurantius]|uniref:L,D-transpeptidase family protein n=1 Tax=Parerythrobacter aurantius TaxID=3127706 RepID=UPI00325038F2
MSLRKSVLLLGASVLLPVGAQAQDGPENLLPAQTAPAIATTKQPLDAGYDPPSQSTVAEAFKDELGAAQAPAEPLVQSWSLEQATALVTLIEGIAAEGLRSADYDPKGLQALIAAGPGAALNEGASQRFLWLVEDMRDGRTPMANRKQWFVMDPDADRMPSAQVMKDALQGRGPAEALKGVAPLHPDYAVLRKALAAAAPGSPEYRQIQANMDRWRWLPRDLGGQYLITNVPEFQLRLTVNDKIMETFRTVVGKPGNTATPQLAEVIEGVVLNPTWTVPQSIVKGEGLGAKVLGNPAWAKKAGYTASRGANGFVTVVQQPGPGNSLGKMKLDMPNRHAIFVHDTPSRHLFGAADRALSHGCIRTENAVKLALTLAILQAGLTADEGLALLNSGKYTKVDFKKKMPVYITYFTMATDIGGKLSSFKDIYGRDEAVLASFNAPRVANRPRVTDEQIIVIEDDLRDIAP